MMCTTRILLNVMPQSGIRAVKNRSTRQTENETKLAVVKEPEITRFIMKMATREHADDNIVSLIITTNIS